MKKLLSLFALLVVSPSVRLLAADGAVEGWHARTFGQAVGYTKTVKLAPHNIHIKANILAHNKFCFV